MSNDLHYPDWAKKELLASSEITGKGQQRIVVGAICRGAHQHTKYKAEGNERAQVQVAKVGIVTTSEKYTIAHSKHVGVHFFAGNNTLLQRMNRPPTTARTAKMARTSGELRNLRIHMDQTHHEALMYREVQMYCNFYRTPVLTSLGKPGRSLTK